MKNKNHFIYASAACLLLLVFIPSCKKSFFTDINVNPNAPSSVVPNVQLSTVQIALGYTMGGDLTRYSGLIIQQLYGANSQSQIYYSYGYNPGAFDNLWPNLYTATMENDYDLMKNADAGGYNVYGGIARILMAFTLQIMVDSWGDIPYSEALKGSANLHPVYDNAQKLYDTIAALVDQGIAQIQDSKQGNIIPSTEDQIYFGNIPQWVKFGHAIKARLYMHQSKGNAQMAANAMTEIGQSFTSNQDNAQYLFGNTQTSANPRYQFNRDRPGDITYSDASLAKEMKALNDPRYNIYFDPANDGLGLDPTGSHYGGLNSFYGSVNSPVEFITYEELLFMKAEATITASGDIATAQGYYTSAIQASMTKLGVSSSDAATYIAANGTLTGSASAAIAQIALQEYIALYLNPESWVLWRRTGSPALVPVTGSAVPRRLLYPQSEYSYNGAHVPPSVTLWAPRIFWDN
jgi:hypothetical protein